jgi:hypothetical protein
LQIVHRVIGTFTSHVAVTSFLIQGVPVFHAVRAPTATEPQALLSRIINGTTHSVMSPLEFMQRLAALVPRPRCI